MVRMSPRQATLLTVLVIVGTVAVGLPAVTAQETATETVATQNDSASRMGAQLTAFLQSNSAAANDTVENGMWQSAYDRSNGTQRAELVTNRAGSLERRLERLQERNATIERRYENGSLSEQAYVAQRSRLTAEIAGLQTAVNDTDAAAEQAGVNDSALERLKQSASKLSAQQAASAARGIAGPPVTPGQGPPDDAGNERSEQGPPDDGAANQSDREPPAGTSGQGANESERGPPDDGPGQQGNESEQGPPGDVPDDSENGTEESDDAAGGEGNGREQGAGQGNDSGDRGASGTESGDKGNGSDSDTAGDGTDSDDSSDADDAADTTDSDDGSDGDSDARNDGENQGNDDGQGSDGGQPGDGGSGQGNGNSDS